METHTKEFWKNSRAYRNFLDLLLPYTESPSFDYNIDGYAALVEAHSRYSRHPKPPSSQDLRMFLTIYRDRIEEDIKVKRRSPYFTFQAPLNLKVRNHKSRGKVNEKENENQSSKPVDSKSPLRKVKNHTSKFIEQTKSKPSLLKSKIGKDENYHEFSSKKCAIAEATTATNHRPKHSEVEEKDKVAGKRIKRPLETIQKENGQDVLGIQQIKLNSLAKTSSAPLAQTSPKIRILTREKTSAHPLLCSTAIEHTSTSEAKNTKRSAQPSLRTTSTEHSPIISYMPRTYKNLSAVAKRLN